MRLDLFLKETRIIKRRTIAKEFCERGLVKANEKVAKPSYEVKSGDVLNIRFGEKDFSVVAKIEIVGKKDKASYEPLNA